MMVTAYNNNMGSTSRVAPQNDTTLEYGMMTGGLRMSNGNIGQNQPLMNTYYQ